MFWADILAEQLKGAGPQKVDDAKTPSGKVHVGALRGVIIHDLAFKALQAAGVPSVFTYIIDDFDPMDSLPFYLDQEKYLPYMGFPLKNVPSPDGKASSYAAFYAQDFINVIKKLGVNPEIVWMSQVYKSGKMNKVLKQALDNHEKIQDIYLEVSGSNKGKDWYPFSPICEGCGRIGTTRTVGWDGEMVAYTCEEKMVAWAKGCGFKGKISPFDGNGKMPWKVEWPARWQALGITVEGEGKDHASRGGSRDIANRIATEIFDGQSPADIPYEHFLFAGKKMSSSKGIGASAEDVAALLPAEILRFLMCRSKPGQAIDFDPARGETIPKLFDEYDRAAAAFTAKSDLDLARVWELSQIDTVTQVFTPRFSLLVNWLQMPNVDVMSEAEKLKGKPLSDGDKKAITSRIACAKIWLEKFAPEEIKFSVQEKLPLETKTLSLSQKELLHGLSAEVGKGMEPEDLQNRIYELGQAQGLSGQDTFAAVYTSLLGKSHGPKAGWLINSLDKDFVKKRFEEV